MIVADTAAILAVVDRRDQRHRTAGIVVRAGEEIVIPTGTIGELA